MKRIISGVLCLILCLSLFAGCGKDKPKQPVETNEITDTEEIIDTADTEPQDTEPSVNEDEAAASLVGVRQAMIGTPGMVAVAYLGETDSAEAADTMELLSKLFPVFLSDLPFIKMIDKDHIIGDGFGETYLVVPCDENASVAVNKVDGSNEVTEVLYRSDYGEPILVYVDDTEIQINIVDNEGNILTYYPTLNDLGYLSQYSDGSIYDLSPYAEMLSREYADLQNYSWKLPEAVDLLDTSWDGSCQLADGSTSSYHISIAADSVYIQHNDGSLTADWKTVTENGVCKLKLYPDTEEERSFCILLSTEHDCIYLSQDLTGGAQYGDEPISMTMERTYG